MASTDLTVRMSYWYKLEETAAGWFMQPCACMSGPAVGEPIFIRVESYYGPYPSKAKACAVGDLLIERMERKQ